MQLRPATIGDAATLFAWRSDALTRTASHNTNELEYEGHVQWLTSSLSSLTRRIYIATIDDIPVGTIRMDMIDGATELSWTVSPQHRGKGIGKQLVAGAMRMIRGPARAQIKVENQASRHIAEAAGLQLVGECNGISYYERDEDDPG